VISIQSQQACSIHFKLPALSFFIIIHCIHCDRRGVEEREEVISKRRGGKRTAEEMRGRKIRIRFDMDWIQMTVAERAQMLPLDNEEREQLRLTWAMRDADEEDAEDKAVEEHSVPQWMKRIAMHRAAAGPAERALLEAQWEAEDEAQMCFPTPLSIQYVFN
jgi:hypothetical protein